MINIKYKKLKLYYIEYPIIFLYKLVIERQKVNKQNNGFIFVFPRNY